MSQLLPGINGEVGIINVTGNFVSNVGTDQYNHDIFTGRQKVTALAKLESKVAFDALLHSCERYPAPKCHPHTRKAAQAVVTDWLCGRGEWAEKGIMWMSGAPGSGKTTIVQTVGEALDSADDESKTWFSWLASLAFARDRKVDGYYFLGRGLGNREKMLSLPATIAFQLCSSTSCRNVIVKTLKKRPRLLTEAFPSQFRHLLTKTAKKHGPITIVIDGLDECENDDDQVQLLNLIFEAVTSTKMRFLIASRSEQHIQAFFEQKDAAQHTYHIRLDDKAFNTSRDIEVFLRAEFARIRREHPHFWLPLPNGEDWPGNCVIVRIRDDSDSQFIFPILAISFIDTPYYRPDQQLQILLEDPPPHAFSKLDLLYERILSRCPPHLWHYGGDGLAAYKELVLGILTAIIVWPESLSPGQIAGVLDKEVDIVTPIVRGPLCTLFKLDRTNPGSPISFIQASFRHFLQDIKRSHQYFISSAQIDALFIRILSRPLHSTSTLDTLRRKALVGILTWVMALEHSVGVPHLASLLDIAPNVVEGVIRGPTKVLFELDSDQNIAFSTPTFKAFLLDASRASNFFVSSDKPDSLFIEVLSRNPPSDPVQAYTQDVLMGVLSVVAALGNQVKVAQIADLLDVPSGLVEGVIYGSTKPLFILDDAQYVNFFTPALKTFLLDASRAGKYFVSSDKTDQILSRAGPSLSDSTPRTL